MVVNRTPEQQSFVDGILGAKAKKPRKKRAKNKRHEYVDPVLSMTQEEKYLYYINNCIWWVNEYKEGRSNLKKLQEVSAALYQQTTKLLTLKSKEEYDNQNSKK